MASLTNSVGGITLDNFVKIVKGQFRYLWTCPWDFHMSEPDKIKKVVELLQGAKSIIFITGAGISADSGLPTYRGIGGLYNGKSTEDGIPIETALAGETITNRPQVTWKYLVQIEEKCRNASFNRAHAVIAQMQKHFDRVWVFTQNIDGFHRVAGSKNIIDIHGDFHNLYCPECSYKIVVANYSEIIIPPRCPKCNHIIRPEVVFFGELLPQDKLKILYEELKKGFDIYFSIGTTSVFPYIQQPMVDAKMRKKPTIEINPAETEISRLVDIKLDMRAAEAMGAIWNLFLKT